MARTFFQRTLNLGVSLFILLLAGLVSFYVWQDYGRTLKETSGILLNQAHAVAENTEATLLTANVVLESVERIINERGGFASLDEKVLFDIFTNQLELFSAKKKDGVEMLALFAVGVDGVARAATTGFPTQKVSTLDREYYRYFSQNPVAPPLLSALSISRLSGLPVVYLTQGLTDKNGRFAGVLGISLRIRHLDNLYDQWQLKEGQTIAIVRGDGKPLFLFPERESYSENGDSKNLSDMSILMAAKVGTQRVFSPNDGIGDRLEGYVVKEQYPLVAIATMPTNVALEPWRQSALVSASIFGLLAAGLLALLRVAQSHAEKAFTAEVASQELRRLAGHDATTGLPSRRSMEQRLRLEWDRSVRYGKSFVVIFADLDHFKRINDQYGHAVGDAALIAVAKALQASARESDHVSRFGGEEFLILMPEAHIERDGVPMAERLRGAIERLSLTSLGGEAIALSASFGVSAWLASDRHSEDVVRRADNAMYAAKHKGRNCVVAQAQ